MRKAMAMLLALPAIASADCNLDKQRFESQMAAVKTLSECYLARSVREDREFIAALYATDNGIMVRIADGEPRAGKATIGIPRHKLDDLIAFWHTHGAPGPGRNLFSPQDTAIAHHFGVPFYLSDPGGVIRVYRPDGEPPRGRPRLSGGSRFRAPAGSAAGDYIKGTRHHIQS